MKPCACGCGELIPLTDKEGRPHRFKNGHNMVGSRHHAWKGWRLTWSGYKSLLVGVNTYMLEHRWVYEQYHKCCLLPWVIIHHMNGDKLDNRIENLEPIHRMDHPRLHERLRNELGRFI